MNTEESVLTHYFVRKEAQRKASTSMLIERESSILASIERGLSDVAANRLAGHEEVTTKARAIIADAKRNRELKRADGWPE